MITLLHGDDQVQSRNRFFALREEARNEELHIISLDKDATFERILLSSQTTPLLEKGIAVFVEAFFTANLKKVEHNLGELSGFIVFWEPKLLPQTLIVGLPEDWAIETFKISPFVFKFLDSLQEQENLKLLREAEKTNEPESILPLLSWHTRLLLWAKEDPKTLNVPLWKRRKLTSQAKKFTTRKLYRLHEKLLKLDRDIKIGTNPFSLSSSLDLLLLDLPLAEL